jgi:methionyl-tRNA synthetase
LREVGLIDKDITRDYEWGPRAPFLDEGQVIYNWSENLIGYISATRDWAGDDEERWRSYWQEGSRIVCFLGKDNLFFHTVLFPALLIGNGDYVLPSQVIVNEFVNIPEGKMSTSRENAIWLHDLLERFEPEVIRYYAAAIAPENRDTVFSWEDLVKRVNADLADTLGNLVNRVLVLAGKIPGDVGGEIQLDEEHSSVRERVQETIDSVIESIDGLEVKRGLEAILELAREGNRFLNEKRPWEKGTEGRETIWVLLELLGTISVLLSPYLPETAEVIWSSLGQKGKISQRGWDECLCEGPREPRVERLILFEKLSLRGVAPGVQ